jgi:rhamnosyltransferase
MPNILILLAAFNGDEWLKEQIDSILNQKNVNVNIVVLDDNSTDSTVDLINSYKDSRLLFSINKCNSGSAGNNFYNLILENSGYGYEYIAFSDQDDIWLCDKLSNGILLMTEANCGGYSSAVISSLSNNKNRKLSQSNKITNIDFLYEGGGQGCTFIVTFSLYKEIRKFLTEHEIVVREFYYHDWFVYLLSRAYKYNWYFDPHPQVIYRQHLFNDTGDKYRISSIKNRFFKIKNQWYKKQIYTAHYINSLSNNELPDFYIKVFYLKHYFLRKIFLSLYLLISGRRKFSDRLVLFFCVIFGYI